MNRFTALVILIHAGLLSLAGCGQDATSPNAPDDAQSKVTSNRDEAGDSQQSELSVATARAVGRVQGTIAIQTLPATLPPVVRQGQAVRDAATCAATEVPDESLIVSPNGGLKNVFVYLKTKPAGYQRRDAPKSEIVFDQRGCRFVPHVMLISTGQTLRVLNADPISHNTRTLTLNNPPLNRVNPPQDRTGFTMQFEHSERVPILVTCDLHPWMRAYHLVIDHTFAATTDAAGVFSIEELPVGEHQFRVWQERAGFLERSLKVTVEANQTTDIQLTYQSDRFDLPVAVEESKS